MWSKSFRTILDRTFQLKRLKGGKWESTKLAPQQSMGQLGKVVKRIAAMIADHYDLSKTFIFNKLGIKDGFWRMVVSNTDVWNICYVLPSKQNQQINLDDIMIVIP